MEEVGEHPEQDQAFRLHADHASAIVISQMFNAIVSYEVGVGSRSEVREGQQDFIEDWQSLFNIEASNTDKNSKGIDIDIKASQYKEWARHALSAVESARMTFEKKQQIVIGSGEFEQLFNKANQIKVKGEQKKEIGFGPSSISQWLKKRTEPGKFD